MCRGLSAMIETWWHQMEDGLPPEDAFSRLRARQLTEAARIFDETGSRDATEFVAFMERYTVRDAESASVVRVMTVHKSKGLGFDVVLLPDLEGRKLDSRRKGLAVQKQPRTQRWSGCLICPTNFSGKRSGFVRPAWLKPENGSRIRSSVAALCGDDTRAKRAMYVIIEPVGDSKSLNYPKSSGAKHWAAIRHRSRWAGRRSRVLGRRAIPIGISLIEARECRRRCPRGDSTGLMPVLDRAVAQPAIRHPARRPLRRKAGYD